MPNEAFRLYNTADETLKVWQRQLNYLFLNLDQTNISQTSIVLAANQVKASNIDFGVGLNQVDASDIPILDASSHYTGGTVEIALAEASTNLSAHANTTAIHFNTTSIDHAGIKNIGTNTHTQIDSHISTTNIHLRSTSISHTELKDIGTLTHAQIDTRLQYITYTSGTGDLLLNTTAAISLDINSSNYVQLSTGGFEVGCKFGCNGSTPVGKYSVEADLSTSLADADLNKTNSLVNQIKTALSLCGITSTST